MKTGVEYLHSKQKRVFDLLLANSLRPAEALARVAARSTFGYEVYFAERVGQNSELVQIPKTRTLDDEGKPLSPLADVFNTKGIDEFPQLELVRSGIMSIIGTRHLSPEDDENIELTARKTNRGRNLLAMHNDIVLPAKRGIVSSFAFQAHILGVNDVETRLALNIHDHVNASATYDARLILNGGRAALNNELLRNIHTPELN